ncbi:DUF3040 domain-containing protein [Lentzea sp. NPDC102401]|uniref:DUF3040 domain-containing protein n=1 Tax=Lentzea sp. NPDC102401 TaxID=3364128 RepID=UPI00381982AB
MLSAQEQQRLSDIERWLRASDPDLARALSQGPLAQRNVGQRVAAFFRKPPRSAD